MRRGLAGEGFHLRDSSDVERRMGECDRPRGIVNSCVKGRREMHSVAREPASALIVRHF